MILKLKKSILTLSKIRFMIILKGKTQEIMNRNKLQSNEQKKYPKWRRWWGLSYNTKFALVSYKDKQVKQP